MPVLSLNDLAWRLSTPLPRLYAIAANAKHHYRQWERVTTKRGVTKSRTIRAPSDELKAIQKLIVKRVFAEYEVHPSAHGGVKKRSTRTNAQLHVGQKCVVNLDARRFYPSVSHHRVYSLLVRGLGIGRDAASLITRLVTYDGQLIQGAPTSSVIANLLLRRPVDEPVSQDAKSAGLNYSRYLDDITLSGDNPRILINRVAQGLSRAGVSMHRRSNRFRLPSGKLQIVEKPKFVISSNAMRQEVTGLVVNGSSAPTVSRSKRDLVRAAINNLRGITDITERRRELDSIRGRIAHVRQFNPGGAQRLSKYLARIVTDLHFLD